MTAIALMAVSAIVAVAAEMGTMFDVRRRAQAAADAAAMAGADQLRRDSTTTLVQSAALAGAGSNGFTDGVGGTTVTTNAPPTSGRFTGDANYVEAIVSQSRSTIFMGMLGFQSVRVGARAVAGLQPAKNCIYALDPTATDAFRASGGAAINAACGVVVNSSSDTALSLKGGSTISATAITVTGNTSGNGFSPAPKTGITPEPDPLAGRPAPTFSGCNYTDTKLNNNVATLGPGVYCNGISISGGAVQFLPGLYVLRGGGFIVSGGPTINGTAVTFYNTGDGSYAYKPVSIAGGTSGKLTAPTSGPMQAMLFFQDRSISSNAANTFSGGGALGLEGSLYFPTTEIDFSGSGATNAEYTVIVGSVIKFTGSSGLNANFASLADGNPIKTVALAE